MALAADVLRMGGPAAFQDVAQRRAELASDIVSAAYLRGDFLLSSGTRSSYYFDKYLFETKPTILRRLASLLAERVPGDVDRIAGPELGAVAISAALSLETGLPFVIVRKSPKGHGTDLSIEGELHSGERVLLVEDVVSTGAQAIQAARQVASVGATIVGILAVVDREHGSSQAVTAAGFNLDALFRSSALPL